MRKPLRTALLTLAGVDAAIVLHLGSTKQVSTPTATVIRTRDENSTSRDIEVVSGANAIGVAPQERVAGFVHIGRPAKPTEDRPRPPLDQIVTRFGAN